VTWAAALKALDDVAIRPFHCAPKLVRHQDGRRPRRSTPTRKPCWHRSSADPIVKASMGASTDALAAQPWSSPVSAPTLESFASDVRRCLYKEDGRQTRGRVRRTSAATAIAAAIHSNAEASFGGVLAATCAPQPYVGPTQRSKPVSGS
jgi:hypothetical protein